MNNRTFTDEIVSDEMAEVLRKKTPYERLQITYGMCRSAVRIIRLNLRRDHPDWTDTQIQQEVARRISCGN